MSGQIISPPKVSVYELETYKPVTNWCPASIFDLRDKS